MEGVNLGAFMLYFLAVFLLGGAALVATGLLLAGWTKAARIVFASGMFAAGLISSLATLSFLQPGMGFHAEGQEPFFAILAGGLFLAGLGPFVGGLRNRRAFALATAFTIGSILIMTPAMVSPDLVGGRGLGLPVSETVLATICLFATLIGLACGIFIGLPAEPDEGRVRETHRVGE
jgi:hypothetical protein